MNITPRDGLFNIASIYPNKPRRITDELIATLLFGWRWYPGFTSGGRPIFIFAQEPKNTVNWVQATEQIDGPTCQWEAHNRKDIARVGYANLPKYSLSTINAKTAFELVTNNPDLPKALAQPLSTLTEKQLPIFVFPNQEGDKLTYHVATYRNDRWRTETKYDKARAIATAKRLQRESAPGTEIHLYRTDYQLNATKPKPGQRAYRIL